ncbi:amino acid permease [Glutamicibacter protophormiae]|uniref:GABA permease n=1 Tax=Kocuria varians TaxID=1272 RepID=A0A7D7KZ98_KOCVA|nr:MULTISPECIES: amino acid permease [Kocuria]WNB88688.1 amino acid permease [Glutamicibacter protophormiae]MDN5631198.1 amino acid permease [Kocuria sp.]QMS55809.1 GABA permease [Kocuria varians]RUP85011.1 amino acid permease [Kocuria sp. HSID17590]RUQ13138.1 amino acid permease [Kocuria sp. HSID17582]
MTSPRSPQDPSPAPRSSSSVIHGGNREHSPQAPSQPAQSSYLKPRHLVMMALGSAIGTGLFVGTGAAIKTAGPAVLISYLVACTLLVLVMRALGEMAAADPSSGAFSTYAGKAMGPTMGRALGWLWWAQIVVVVAAEATAAAQLVTEMWPGLPQWVWALVFMVAFTVINLVRVGTLGETEFWFALLKVAAVVGFLVVGVLMLLNVLPAPNPGLSNLTEHGGFMPNGLTGVAAALLVVVFAFGGTELVTIAAAETEDPQTNVARAIRTILVRILIFYVGSVTVMVLVLPWNNEGLSSSPFVAVLTEAGIPGADVLMTVVIILALLSALNANIYGSSRMLFSLARRGSAPRALGRTSERGVPRAAVVASVAFGFIAVVLNYVWPETVLNVMLNVIGSTCLVVWGVALVSQIILRRRADRAGVSSPLKMWAFPWLSYFALALLAAIVVLGLLDPSVRLQFIATFVLVCLIALACKLLLRGDDAERPGSGASRDSAAHDDAAPLV